MVRWLRRTGGVPPVLAEALDPEERLMGLTTTTEGYVLAASRFGLWLTIDDAAERWDWHRMSKARLAHQTLSITMADEVGELPGGTVLLRDRPAVALHPTRLTKLTDTVHHRVRRSVVASRHLDLGTSGCWVVLRKVAGRDGLTVQVRLDDGADARMPGFASAVDAAVDNLWPPEVPRKTGEAG